MQHEPIPLDPYTFGSEQTCWGCGPHNPIGIRLRFYVEGDEVVSRFTPMQGYEGPPGIFHGGLQATLLDEVAGWTLVGLRKCMGFTTSMQVRYMRPVRINQEVVARGRITHEEGSSITIRTALEQEGRVACRATVTYRIPDRAAAERTLGRELPPEWLKFCK